MIPLLTKILTQLFIFFTTNKIGLLLQTIFSNMASTMLTDVANKKNQAKAYEFVKELNADPKLTNAEKAKLFNQKLLIWAKETGQKELSDAVVNCLRELAVCKEKAKQTKVKKPKEKIITK